MCVPDTLLAFQRLLLQLLMVFFLFSVNTSLYAGYSEHVLDSFILKQSTSFWLSILFQLQSFFSPPLFKTSYVYFLTFHSHFNPFSSGSCCHYSHWTVLGKFTAKLYLANATGHFAALIFLGFHDSTLCWSFLCLTGCCFSFSYADFFSSIEFLNISLSCEVLGPLLFIIYLISSYTHSIINIYWVSTMC